MADWIFNIALGRAKEFYQRTKDADDTDPGFIVVLLKTAEADGTLRDYDTLSALLAGSNVEADFTNYARKTLQAADISATPSPDDTNNLIDLDLPDQTWTSAGGTTDNTLAKLVICYAPDVAGADSTLIPVAGYDFVVTTDGSDLDARFNSSGAWRAAAA